MKEKVTKGEKKPWYMRLDSYFWDKEDHKPTRKEKIKEWLIFLAIFFLAGVIGYGISYVKNTIPYEEAHDVEYCAYVNEKLEDVASEVIDKNIGINLSKIPDIVSKYEIKYTGKRIDFTYWLDTEQVIWKYCLETGNTPKDSDARKDMVMNVQISKDFQDFSISPFGDTVPTREKYEGSLPAVMIIEGIFNGLGIFIAFGFVTLILGVIAGIASGRFNIEKEFKDEDEPEEEEELS